MKYLKHSKVKSITRKALIISMVLHVLLLTTLFYFSITEQTLLPIKDKLDVSITTVPKQMQVKMPMKAPIPQVRQTTLHEAEKMPVTKVETIHPQVEIHPRLTPTTPIETDQPRLNKTETAPDIDVNVSTALKQLQQVEDGLSTKEAAQPILSGSLGTKRSGSPGIQRGPVRSTLDIAGTTGGDGNPTEIVDFQEKKPPLPRITFGNVMKKMADDIAETSEGGPIDVIFVIDASGSMGDNIYGVVGHLSDMIDVYKSSDLDYSLGLTTFNANQVNNIKIHQLTKDLSEYKQMIRRIKPKGDEHALDAIEKTVYNMEFRATSKKHLILVTDEPFTSMDGNTVRSTIDICREFGIYVNVLGLALDDHKKIALDTDGKWHAIPQKLNRRPSSNRNTSLTEQVKQQILRNAKWSDVQLLSKVVLQNAENTPIDIVLFIDGSNSMDEKLLKFYLQLKTMVRDWDNALIDYQIGVVSFRMRGSVKSVNVYDPPQTIEQIEKIVELPSKTDEDLLHAISQGLRKIELRQDAQTHLIIVTDEPLPLNAPAEGMIKYLQEKHVIVSVVGTIDDFQEQVTEKTGGVWVPIPGGHTTNNTYW
ncbi:MAG: VWA domain-containing protein [Candidatus Poribacteria bacterium]|nr:VWA domain-containing protein [Candidatus Poribacteria bacterium]